MGNHPFFVDGGGFVKKAFVIFILFTLLLNLTFVYASPTNTTGVYWCRFKTSDGKYNYCESNSMTYKPLIVTTVNNIDYVYFVSAYLYQSTNNNVWDFVYYISGQKWACDSVTDWSSNYDIPKNGNSIFKPKSVYQCLDYYIQDGAFVFTNDDVVMIEDMERKMEQNAHVQFFIKTYSADLANELTDMKSYGDTKSPTGWGSLILYIQKRSNGTMRLGWGQSDRLNRHFFPPYDQKYAYAELHKLVNNADDVNSKNIVAAYENIYSCLIGDENCSSIIIEGMKSTWCVDENASNYVLAGAPIPFIKGPKGQNGYINEFVFENHDGYNNWGTFVTNHSYDCEYFWEVAASQQPKIVQQPTPSAIQAPLPPVPSSGEKSPFTQDTIKTVNPSGLDTKSGIDMFTGILGKIQGKIPADSLKNIFMKLNLNTGDYHSLAPVISVNLHSMANSTKNISGVDSTLPDTDTQIVDFRNLEKIKYFGAPVIDYFRGLIGALLLFNTAMYIWKRLVPSDFIAK